MRTFLLALLLASQTSLAAPKAEKTKAPAEKKPSNKIELVLTVGDVTEVKLAEIWQKNVVDEVQGGRVVGETKYYRTDKDKIVFYGVDVQLAAGPAKEYEKITAENGGKKLIVKVGSKFIQEMRIRDIVSDGVLHIEPPRPRYDPKSDGSKESAQSKAAAEKLVKDLQKKLLKAK